MSVLWFSGGCLVVYDCVSYWLKKDLVVNGCRMSGCCCISVQGLTRTMKVRLGRLMDECMLVDLQKAIRLQLFW